MHCTAKDIAVLKTDALPAPILIDTSNDLQANGIALLCSCDHYTLVYLLCGALYRQGHRRAQDRCGRADPGADPDRHFTQPERLPGCVKVRHCVAYLDYTMVYCSAVCCTAKDVVVLKVDAGSDSHRHISTSKQ